MKNYAMINETATATIETAVNHEIASGMKLVLSDKLSNMKKQLEPSKDGTPVEAKLTPVKIASIKEDIQTTEKAIADFSATVESTEEVFSSVVSDMVNAGNERENVLTFLRLIAGIEQKDVMKYALPATEDLSELVESLDTIHKSGKYSAVGAMTMTKESKLAFKNAKEQIENLIFNRFNLSETPYTKKFNPRFNSTDLGELHACYVTGVKNEFDKNNNFTGRTLTTRVAAANKNNTFTRFNGLKVLICNLMVAKVCK